MSMTLALICGDAPRHAWLARRLAGAGELGALVVEAKVDPIATSTLGVGDDAVVLREHFAQRARVELDRMGVSEWPAVPTLRAAKADSVLRFLQAQRPAVVVLFGCGIVGPELLGAFEGRVVNLHLGLSPWYRGTGTNFWPLFDGRPEYVGATLHLATRRVDHGEVLCQVRPQLDGDDDCHLAGFKALEAAAAELPRALADFHAGRLRLHPAPLADARPFRRADLTGRAVRTMRENFAMGMMQRFAAARPERLAGCPILEVRHA